MDEPIYLKHLEGAIPEETHGYTVSSYCMALEGWRRGLTLKFINKNRRKSELVYSLSNGDKEHIFSVARGDLVPRKAINICMNKDLTKQALLDNNVPTPLGKAFEENTTDESYAAYGKEIGYPVVVKPVDGTGGKGVITGIENEKELLSSIEYVKKELNFERLIIENYVPGNDYRLYVLEDKVIGAFTRDRANVIGDGKSTIKELVSKKNKLRASNPALKGKSKISLDHEAKILLQEKNYDFQSVPKEGEKIYLNTKNNVSSGGDPTDATDLLNEEIKQVAVDAAKAIPGLVQGGVDLIIDEQQTRAHVLEINSRPHIRAHLFPMKGQARDIPKEIIDYYFPETKSVTVSNALYFDFETMYKSFTSGFCEEYTILNYPTGEVILTRFEITGLKNKKEFADWCRTSAKKLKLHGHVKGFENKVSLVMSGNRDSLDKFKQKLLKLKDQDAYKTMKYEEKYRKTPVKTGFRISGIKKHTEENVKNINTNNPNVDGYFPVKMDFLKTQKEKKIKGKSKKASKSRNSYYRKEYEKVVNSTSWKLTKPIRLLGKIKE